MSVLNFKARVPVIDANIGVGHRHDRPHPTPDRPTLLQEMHRHGVDRAVLYQVQGESISQIDGNQALTTWANDDGLFVLQWMAGSSKRSLDQLQGLHADGRLSCVRLTNTDSAWNPFVHWIYGELLEWLQAENIPLWVSLAESDSADVVTTLTQFPDLVTVLVGAHYTHALWIRPLLNNIPRAHLELSRYEVLGEVEALRDEFGIERLVYGSFFPRYQMGPMLFYLHHLDFSEDELAAVCAGNVERILQREGTGR